MKSLRTATAFTLLELLVAVGVSLVLAVLLFTLISQSLNLWQRTQGRMDTAASARLALDFLERDLQGALHRDDDGRWLAVDILDATTAVAGHGWLVTSAMKPSGPESLRLLPTEPGDSMANARFGLSGCWLRFVASNMEANDVQSTPVVISYQLARRPPTGAVSASNQAGIRYRLYRTAVSATVTFNLGYDVRAAGYSVLSANPSPERSAQAVTSPSNAEALADDVIDFGVWLYARNPDGSLRRTFPAGSSSLSHAAPQDDAFPVVADVMMRILTADGAGRLDAIEQGRVVRPPEYASDAAWWWAVAEANSRVFTRRIVLQGGPL
jgi:type II secretory pathway pseudopilin PulG